MGKITIFFALGLHLILTCQAEQRLVLETFETGAPDQNVVGHTTSDQNAVWRSKRGGNLAQLVSPAAATYGVDKAGVPEMILAAAGKGVCYITLDSDMDGHEKLRVKIASLNLNGTDMNFQFIIGARKSSVAIAYGYVFRREEGGYRVYYKGAPETDLVPVSDRKLDGMIKNLELVVGKDFQQLHIDGQQFDDRSRPTQATAGRGEPNYLDLITIASGNGKTFANPRLQLLEVVAE
ncbi:MAG: hypothetical protein B9S32_13200 [Verrucomicrobia bacterium Tous-C9LFEB]|nr:MAG: hypothetical protein B9S32_13200 [Verrucomicrobia bacterium Tous-C9LFEB]